ncbi:transcription initiation factor IIB [Methanobrevibacter sp.]|uniref:transcription initiation factor IIB n=1 Tax=Methanobrevibacter sp. TaxID=66852 RepID=UPI0037430DEF
MLAEDVHQRCPVCNSTDIREDTQRAEVFCGKCSTVLDEFQIDQGPEWRAFDHEQRDRRARTGAPSTYAISDKGLATIIDWRNVDSNGRSLSENSAQLNRIRILNKRARIANARERNLALALSTLHRYSSKLGIPKTVREDSSWIYRNAAKKQLIRGRSIEGMVATSIYTSCRRCNIPRTLDEISEVSNVSKKQIGKNHRFLCRELGIKLKPTSPADYISRFGSKLGLSGETQAKAVEIINKANEKGLSSGRGPTGVAAAALYIAAVLLGERKTQSEIANVAGVTEVTIRNRYKELSEKVNVVI